MARSRRSVRKSTLTPGARSSPKLEQLMELFSPDDGRGWAAKAPSRPMVDESGAPVLSVDHVAWAALAVALEDAEAHPAIANSEEVRDFVSSMRNACDLGIVGGVDEVFSLFETVAARRAAAPRRISGADTRARVLEAWRLDVQAGKATRGRISRIAEQLSEAYSTVRDAVVALRKDGKITSG